MTPSQPLSPVQDGRWRAHLGAPDFPWHVSLSVRVGGALDPSALQAALERAVARHEILRTRFEAPAEGGDARMVVDERRACSLELHDWSTRTLVERERDVRRLEQSLRAAQAPSGETGLRVALARVTDDEHVLILAHSALAADWRALWILAQELARDLAGTLEREPPVQFADLAHWLREAPTGDDEAAGRDAWRAFDARAAADLRLPLEVVRASRPFGLEELARELAPRLQDALTHLAEGRRVSVESILCSAWQAWLARLCDVDELTLGVASPGRAFHGLEHALGPFERLVPVHARLDERSGLAQLARRTDEQLARAAEWHEHFLPERHGADAGAAFAHAFEFLPREPEVEHGALRLEVLRRDGWSERAHTHLRVEETATGLELRYAFDPRRLAPADAEAVLAPYLALLENALTRPDSALAALATTTPEQHGALLALARGPALRGTPAEPRTIHEWVLASARGSADAPAVAAGGRTLTYRELEQRSAALAAELAARGAAPGSLVGVHLERSLELVVALLAVLRTGAGYVPLPPSYPRERVLAMLADSRASLVVGGEASHAQLAGFRGGIVIAAAHTAARAFEPARRADPDDLAYVIYTSGSTGKPKGVPITHANLVFSTRARVQAYPERVRSYLLLSSFAFDSSVAGLFWTLVQGGTLVLPPEGFEKDLGLLPDLVARHGVTHVLGLPSLWSFLLDAARAGELETLTTVIVAGESCPPELVQRHRTKLPKARLYNEYGPTEGTVWSSVFDTGAACERPQVPIGRPIPGAASYVLTRERELAPLGLAGDLWIGGPGVARGYLGQAELSAERFADDPFSGGRMYKTGDRARWLADGNLEFLGRADHQVKIRGYRIELEEIEAALSAHAAVREAVVLARRDEGAGGAAREPMLVAYVVAVGPRPAETDLLRYLAARLPEYMVPTRAVCLPEWPRLPNGKIDRRALPAPEDTNEYAEPEGALEVVLAALWADVLGLEVVGRHDDFFALGGHSLSVTRLYARLRETLQVTRPLRVLFEHRTPAALAAELTRDAAEAARITRQAEVVLAVLEADENEHAVGA
jgi:amino acid adenylation domain-containing protein